MKALILYAHPNPKSFCHAIKETLEEELKNAGVEFQTRDLYALGFDPVLKGQDFAALQKGTPLPDIQKEQTLIRDSQLIAVVHPVWWFGLPAILKGYIERVFSFGFAYRFTAQGELEGLLAGRKAAIFSTTGGPEVQYQHAGYAKAIGTTVDHGIFQFCGVEVLLHQFFYAVPTISQEAREKMLLDLRQIAKSKLL